MTGAAPRTRRRDRVVVAVARMLARAFYRSVEVAGERPARGRVILAASHLNGFVDPVLLVARLGRLPRFLAKSTLWSILPARIILNFLGAVPVQRRVDAGDATDNRATFAAAVQALEKRHTVAVFPEGTTHDDPGIRPLRTGVARIALAASAAGVDGVRIVPVGISYEDKVSARGRALIEFGPPIAVPDDATLDDSGAPRHEEVDDLTARLEAAIRAATPDFASTEDAVGVSAGAAIALRPPGRSPDAVRMADRAVLARRVTAAGPDATGQVVDAAGRYQLLLGTVGLVDAQVANGRTITYMARHTALLTALVVILAPFALAGLFTNLLPALVVLVAGTLPRAPVTKGTVRLLVAVVVFPLTWLAIAVWDVRPGWWSSVLRSLEFPLHPVIVEAFGTREGFWPSLFVFLSIPVLGFLALLFVERVWALLRDWRAWRARVDRRGQLDHILDRRATVAALTLEVADGGAASSADPALGAEPGQGTPGSDTPRPAEAPADGPAAEDEAGGARDEVAGDVARAGDLAAGGAEGVQAAGGGADDEVGSDGAEDEAAGDDVVDSGTNAVTKAGDGAPEDDEDATVGARDDRAVDGGVPRGNQAGPGGTAPAAAGRSARDRGTRGGSEAVGESSRHGSDDDRSPAGGTRAGHDSRGVGDSDG